MNSGKLADPSPKEGYLEKKMSGMFERWQRRYVKLDDRELSYFEEGQNG